MLTIWATVIVFVVAQLVERSLPTPEIRDSNPDIGKILSTNCTLEKTKNYRKEARNGPFSNGNGIMCN